jgi:hypothetical protein
MTNFQLGYSSVFKYLTQLFVFKIEDFDVAGIMFFTGVFQAAFSW